MIREELHHLEEQYEKEVTGIVEKSGQLLRSKYGLWVLGAITFVDSAAAFPGPIDPFLAAYIISNRAKAGVAFVLTVASSVLGGLMLYLFTSFFTDQIIGLLSPESQAAFNGVVSSFDQGTFMLAFLGAFTPVPYGLVVIAAGALKGNVFMFIAGSILGRSLRFGIVAYLTYRFGERAVTIAKENVKLLSLIVIAGVSLYILSVLYL